MSIFRLYPAFKMSIEHKSDRKNLFLSACFCWDSRISLGEMGQKIKFGGTIGYGDSYLEFFFVISKYLDYTQYYLMLLEQCGHIMGKGFGYCYTIGRGPNSCLLCHVIGLLFCLYVKIFDIELTEKNIIKELGLYIDGSVKGFSFCPPKTFKPKKQTTWNTTHFQGVAWSSGKLDYDKFFAVFYDIKVINAEVFAKGLEKCRLMTIFLGQNVENLNDQGCPKIQGLVKTDSSWICSSYLFRHKTRLHCTERKKNVRRMGYAFFVSFCTCLLYLCLLLI